MRTFNLLALIAILMCACNRATTPTEGKGFLTATFTLSDTTGQASTVFHSGQQFDVSFSVTNTTMETLTYYYTLPPVIFQILKGDTSVATSVDGYVFPQVVLRGYLAPGRALQGAWKAPNTPAQNPKVVLAPGSYEAHVSFRNFEQVKVNQVSPITFSIVQ